MSNPGRKIDAAVIGLVLSVLGVVGLSLFSVSGSHEHVVPVASLLTLLSVPGFVCSLVALRISSRRRIAAWGAGLGLIGSLYVPTILIFAFRAIHANF